MQSTRSARTMPKVTCCAWPIWRSAATWTRLAEELAPVAARRIRGIPVVRSLQRRLLMLAPARARIERGESPDAVMTSLGKTLFWKDKALVGRMLAQWDAERLAKVAERAGRLERGLMFSPAPGQEALGEELARDRARSAPALDLDRLAREALADHVELVEARIMKRNRPALPLVSDLNL